MHELTHEREKLHFPALDLDAGKIRGLFTLQVFPLQNVSKPTWNHPGSAGVGFNTDHSANTAFTLFMMQTGHCINRAMFKLWNKVFKFYIHVQVGKVEAGWKQSWGWNWFRR